MAASSPAKRSIARIAGVVVPIAIAVFLVLQQANFLVGRSLLIAFGDHETTYRSAWFEWDGDIVARDVVVDAYGLGPEAAIRFDRVHVETPGWWWFLRNTFDRKLKRAKLDRVHLTLTGVTSEAGFEPSLGDLGPFGAASASPFETEGCMQHSYWARDELTAMGLTPGPTRLEFDYRVAGSQVATTVTLDTPGVSSVTLQRSERLEQPVNALLLDYAPTLADSEQWTVVDAGFVQARNRFCAQLDGIGETEFVRRHVASVQRLLHMAGLAADTSTLDTYRAFASTGGTLTFGGKYLRPLSKDEFYDVRDSGEALLRMDAGIERNGQRLLVQWQRFDPQPLAGLEEGEPTYAAMLRERNGDAPAVPTEQPDAAAQAASVEAAPATAQPAAAAPAETTPSTTQPAAPVAAAPATTQPAATAQTAAPAPTQPAAPSPAASTTATAATATPPAAAPPAQTRPAARPVATVAAPPTPPANPSIEWAQLAQHKDAHIRVWTVHGPPRTVVVLDATPQELRVRSRLGGGYAEFTIARESFKRAVAL